MNKDVVWSENYGCYVSRSFLPESERVEIKKSVKIDIAKCIIKESCFGYYSLWLNDRRLKDIDFMTYLKYRDFVKEVLYYGFTKN